MDESKKEELKQPLVRKSLRSDTLSQASFFNSFLMGQAVKKRSGKSRLKVELTPEQRDLNDLMQEANTYILKNAENTLATPFMITCVAMSPDSSIILYGSSNGNISRYDMEESKIVDDIPLNIGILNQILLYEDNSKAIIVGESPIIRIYKLPRFELESQFEGHTLQINTCVMSASKELLFTVSDDSTVRMWDMVSLKEKGVILKHTGMGKSIATTNDGRYVFSGGEDCLVRVFDMTLNEEVLNLKSHLGCIWSLSVNFNSTLLASGAADNIVIVWNIMDFTPMHVFSEHTGVINVLKFTEDAGFLISGSGDNSLKVWDLEKDRREITLNAHIGPIRDFILTSENEYIVSCSEDKSIKVWSFPDFLEESNFKIMSHDFNSVIEVNKTIISCGTDHNIRYWKRYTDEAGVIYATEGIGLKCCASPDSKYLAVSDDFGYLYIFDSEYQYIRHFQAHKGSIRDMCFIQSGELVTGGGDSKVLIWNPEDWTNKVLKGHQQSIWCLAYTATAPKVLASGSSDKTIRIWDLEGLYEMGVLQVQEQATALAITADCRYLISGGIMGALIVWNIFEKIEESIFNLHTDMVTGIVIIDDGETILTASKDRSLHFISLTYRVPISSMTRKQQILCLAINEERDEIITGEHQTIYIQDNPVVCLRTRILGPEDNVQKFLTYMKALINGQLVPHDPEMDKFIMVPYFFNTLHFFSFMGLRDYLMASLNETATIIPSKNGYHPLKISLLKGYKGVRDDVVDSLISLGNVNPFLFQILENVMVDMNKKAFPKLGEIYEAIYRPANRRTLPKFCSPEVPLPSIYISEYPRVIPEYFMDKSDYTAHGQGILFKESYVKLNYVMGSEDSIKFLESLASCTNLDVMRSQLIQAMILYKWEMARFPMMVQGCCFYFYLILLSAYTVWAVGNEYFQIVLLLINTLLLLYEVFQMSVSGSFYFTYAWNYIDWLRSLSLYFYIAINMMDSNNNFGKSVFSVTVFLSFIRGISYFRIFDLTRYLINLLFQVINDILGFLTLLVYSTLAFCFLFMVLEQGSDNPFSVYLMASYNLALGGFDSEAEYNIIQYVCLTFALLINPIIMLNLLISIIGDTYDRVQSDSLSADMKELMDMIQEVENMLFFRRKQNKKQFFQECSEYEKQDQEGGWEGKLRALENIIESIKEKNAESHSTVMKKIKAQDQLLALQSEKIDLIAKRLEKDREPTEKKKKVIKQ